MCVSLLGFPPAYIFILYHHQLELWFKRDEQTSRVNSKRAEKSRIAHDQLSVYRFINTVLFVCRHSFRSRFTIRMKRSSPLVSELCSRWTSLRRGWSAFFLKTHRRANDLWLAIVSEWVGGWVGGEERRREEKRREQTRWENERMPWEKRERFRWQMIIIIRRCASWTRRERDEDISIRRRRLDSWSDVDIYVSTSVYLLLQVVLILFHFYFLFIANIIPSSQWNLKCSSFSSLPSASVCFNQRIRYDDL